MVQNIRQMRALKSSQLSQKDEMINKARTIPSNLQKAITSPKKRGGSLGGSKKKVKILGSNGSIASMGGGGGQMKRGGACGLPGGRSDMRNKRR